MSSNLEEPINAVLQEAVSSGKFLGVSFVVVDKHGNIRYSGAHGSRDFRTREPMTVQTGGWVASMTKLMTAVATMSAVDQGLVGLGDDVTQILPELRKKLILTSYDEGTKTARYAPLERPITLRQLLTHTAGLSYPPFHPLLDRWSTDNDRTMDLFYGDFERDWNLPMVCQPGDSWYYGQGLDWAGKVLEKVSGKSLEEFMKEKIWVPLAMHNSTFHPETRSSFPMLDMGTRENGLGSTLVPGKRIYPVPAQNEAGGAGLFTTADDYAKLLTALLRDGGPVLTPQSAQELLKPQLEEVCKAGLTRLRDEGMVLAEIAKDVPVDHALGGLLVLDNVPEGRARGTVAWDGLSNPNWLLDPFSGIAMVLFVQVLPVDPDTKALWRNLEREVYKAISN